MKCICEGETAATCALHGIGATPDLLVPSLRAHVAKMEALLEEARAEIPEHAGSVAHRIRVLRHLHAKAIAALKTDFATRQEAFDSGWNYGWNAATAAPVSEGEAAKKIAGWQLPVECDDFDRGYNAGIQRAIAILAALRSRASDAATEER